METDVFKSHIDEFVGPCIVIHPDERSNIVAFGKEGVTKRYYSSQVRSFSEQSSVEEDAIV